MDSIQPKPLMTIRFSQKNTSCSLGKEELRTLLDIIEESVEDAGNIEVSHLDQGERSAEEFEYIKNALRKAFYISLTVTGTDGTDSFGRIEKVFEPSNFPDDVKSIYANSTTNLKTIHDWIPRNSIELFFDFTKPAICDLSILPSQATPNTSYFTVTGLDSLWANGLFHKVQNFLIARQTKFSFLHRNSVYDILVLILGIPLAFWVLYKLSPCIEATFNNVSSFVRNAFYVFIFFIALNIFRLLFHYARWIWPLVEFKSSKNRAMKQRRVLATIFVAIIAGIITMILWGLF